MSAHLVNWRQMLVKRRWLLLGLWVGALVWASLATWLKVAGNHREIGALEQQLGELDRWNVAGLWLSRSLAARERAVGERWGRLFPTDRLREELFLELASIADTSGVRAFELSEQMAVAAAEESGTDMVAPTTDLAPVTTYRIEARFQGDYREVARFLGGLNTIERAMSLHNLAIRPARGAVEVELELDIYVSKSLES